MLGEVSTLESLAFATKSFVGNLGAPVRVSDEDDEDDEDESLQEQSNDEHELRERNGEGQGVLIVEDA